MAYKMRGADNTPSQLPLLFDVSTEIRWVSAPPQGKAPSALLFEL